MTTLWERVKTGSKTGFDKTWAALDKVGAPVNRLSNKLGSEAFWPTTLDKECDKAARILKSFCRDGFYAEEEYPSQEGPTQKQRVVKKIPAKVIQNAKGLAIFTTLRTGLWLSGAGGSGILIAKKSDGSWSPPSGILLHTAGLGFMVGIDIYDCVVVINSDEALEAFYKVRCTLGSEISVAAGPVGAGGVLDTEIHKRQAPIFTYMKSRGFYAGVQIDGTVIIERSDENERFYGQKIAVKDILGGQVRHPPFEVKRLLETIKAAQGDNNYDESVLPSEPPPSDYDIDDGRTFGVPDKEDPDPYGVLALEKEGMRVVQAGTHEPASWEQFTFDPSPTSPVHSVYNRNSVDYRRSMGQRSSWRGSQGSATPTTPTRPSSLRQSIEFPAKSSTMTDSSTQTEQGGEPPMSPVLNGRKSSISRHSSKASVSTAGNNQQMQDVPEHTVLEVRSIDASDGRTTEHSDAVVETVRPVPALPVSSVSPSTEEALGSRQANGYRTPPTTPPLKQEEVEGDPDDIEIVQPELRSVQTFKPTATPVVSKARLVTVAKRVPPKLPPRNPTRSKQAGSPTSMASEGTNTSTMPEMEPLNDAAIELPPASSLRAVSPVPVQTEASLMATTGVNGDALPGKTTLEAGPTEESPTNEEEIDVTTFDMHEPASKRLSTLSNQSNGSSTWDKVRALRAIDDDDD